jgi:hypothetical protein
VDIFFAIKVIKTMATHSQRLLLPHSPRKSTAFSSKTRSLQWTAMDERVESFVYWGEHFDIRWGVWNTGKALSRGGAAVPAGYFRFGSRSQAEPPSWRR